MSKFCGNCGAELTGTKCEKCGKVSAEATMNKFVNKVKNYDYKAKAEDIKSAASDLAEKAKKYDYKAKAEEIKETVKRNKPNKSKVKRILFVAILFLVVIGLFAGYSKITEYISFTPKGAVELCFEQFKKLSEISEHEEFMSAFVDKMDYKIVDVSSSDEGTATVVIEVTTVDLGEIIQKSMQLGSADSADIESIMAEYVENSKNYTTKESKITVKKNGILWMVESADELISAVVGDYYNMMK